MSEHSGSDSDEGPPPQSPLDLYHFNNRIQTRRQATHARDAKSTVNVKTFLLCRARASRGSAFGRVPDAICRLIAAIAGGCFVPADGFRGRREGCVFKLGGRGLGYYPDFAALEQAARDRELSSEDRVRAIKIQLEVDSASPPASAEAWDGLLSRLQELDRLTTDDPGTNAIIALIGGQVFGLLLDLRNSQGRRFLRQIRIGVYSGKTRVELIQPSQPSKVETAVAELARDLVAKYKQLRAHYPGIIPGKAPVSYF